MALLSGWGDIGQVLDKIDYVPEDSSWLQYLPEGSSVMSAAGYGGSYWSQTGKIDVRLRDGKTEAYLIKLYKISPDILPRPIGWGTYKTDEDVHFFLCEFIDLYDELPDVVDFCQAVAELHRKSLKHAPKEFGFHVTTCNETNPQCTTKRTVSWEAFFTELLREAFELEEQVHGFDEEISVMQDHILNKVCPRLLRPLEAEGRTLRPCLVHGDLWDGNIAVHAKTGRPVIFDASSFWAHNEYELHIWRGTRYRIGKSFMREYFIHFPISPPEDDYNYRNLLYSLMADLHSSALFTRTERFRELLIQSMRELVREFPNGYEGPAKRKDVAVAAAASEHGNS